MNHKDPFVRVRRSGASLLAACAGVVLLAQPGTLDPSFDLSAYAFAQNSVMAALPDGNSILAGYFDNGSDPPFLVGRFFPDGSLDPSFQVGNADGGIYDVAVQPDGKILLSGDFMDYAGAGHPYVVRLNTDGSVDNTFNYVQSTGPFSHWVEVVSLQADGKVLIAGALEYNGTYPPMKRLLPDGSNDVAFMTAMGSGPNFVGMVEMIEQPDGAILLAGAFTAISGNSRDKVARLLPNGQVDPSFAPVIPVPANTGGKFAQAMKLQPDGRILVSAFFHLDQSGNYAAGGKVLRFLQNGAADPGWSVITADAGINDMVLTAAGPVVLGGEFTVLNGTNKNYIAQLDANGQVQTSYPAGTGPDYVIFGMEQQYDGKILLSGVFTAYDGVARPGWARIQDCFPYSFNVLTDANGAETTWEVLDGNGAVVECSGGGYANNSGCLGSSCCVPAGAHVLKVYDAGTGMNGSYQLRSGGRGRIVHNSEGFSGALAQHGTDGVFHTDMGSDRLNEQSCDANGLTTTGFVRALSNPAVAAQVVPPGNWSQQPSNSGYEFWFFDPDGGYSKTVYQNLRVLTSQGSPDANARYLKLNNTAFSSDPLPLNRTLNVRVRGRVAGVNRPWGPACRIKVNGTADAYWETHLVDVPGDPVNACNAVRDFDAVSVDNTVLAVRRVGTAAYHYRFRWERSNGTFFFVDRTSGSLDNNRYMVLSRTNDPSWMPNWPINEPDPLPGEVFTVRVATRKAGTQAWSAFGPCCTVTIGSTSQLVAQRAGEGEASPPLMSIWPNPNMDRQLHIAFHALEEPNGPLRVELVDATGRVAFTSATIITTGGPDNVFDLAHVRPGLYVVRASMGAQMFTERVVLE